jgi:hypothetical protein
MDKNQVEFGVKCKKQGLMTQVRCKCVRVLHFLHDLHCIAEIVSKYDLDHSALEKSVLRWAQV